jgi:hypothetical protein
MARAAAGTSPARATLDAARLEARARVAFFSAS